ncbi:hypothetical protein AWC38_SpisGene9906 [Stylophora pistillata]|uniref:THD domain-containing protein n=1 Tax=Stylophora pistillata TaxID=50429 RepID=A0A2B4SAH1_STYPI|nr:hypothetical protein AWC38_SpisGene9906 [Stylophora pistillata]
MHEFHIIVIAENSSSNGCPILGQTIHDPLPLAHIEASNKEVVQYDANQAITDWDLNNVHSRLQGRMKYNSGCLTVPEDGAYYVYAQVFFRTAGRVYIQKNQKQVFTMVQHPINVPQGPQYTGGVLHLKAGDVISLYTA